MHINQLSNLAVKAAAFLAVTLSLAGCLTTEHPLSTSKHEDPAVLGHWVEVKQPGGAEPMVLDISAAKDGMYVVDKTEVAQGSPPRKDPLSVFLTKGQKHTYANMLYQAPIENPETKAKSFQTRYLLYRYSIKNEQLEITSLGYDELDAAVKAGKLHGKTWATTWGVNAVISDKSPELLEFFESPAGESVFTEKILFARKK